MDPQVNSRVTIGLISSVILLVLVYPWVIVVTVICFVIGFRCSEQADRFIKLSIASGRFGIGVQEYFKEYINAENSSRELSKGLIKEVTEDPLSDYLEESQSQILSQQEQQKKCLQIEQDLARQLTPPPLYHNTATLSIPVRNPSSGGSSPEKSKPGLESPRSLSAASSRRVSEDVQGVRARETPSPTKSSTAASTPSPTIRLSTEIAALRVDQEFRVSSRVDKAFGQMFTNIINYYISPSWAPYDTRRQLRLSLKQLLTPVAEQFNRKLLCNERNSPVKLTRQKLIPLLLHYVDKILSRGLRNSGDDEASSVITKEERRRIVLKIRKFCRKIFERFLTKDDKNCRMWMELCIAVLADGVLVNVMELGKEKLPELLEELYEKLKQSKMSQIQPSRENVTSSNQNGIMDPLSSENYMEGHVMESTKTQQSELSAISANKNSITEKVPFLLDSFLDPPNYMDKPDSIVSRWRPSLKDIVCETDLLYPLIQYMKHVGGQQSLAYLQGVLDDFPNEGDPYCRRVLELEYLPGFCRSNLFLETMGLSRVEMAMEVGTFDSAGLRRSSSGHARSASYGGPSTNTFRDFLQIEQGIVDGLPLTESSYQSNLASTVVEQPGAVATLPGAGVIEPNLAFKRRPHLEMFIAKFIKSTTKSWKQYYDPLEENCYEPVKRAGIDAKSYEEWDHPEVNSRVNIKASTSDIYDSVVDLVTSLMRDSPIASPFLSGLANFLKPYLMPLFDDQLDKNLTEILSEDLLVSVVDLIASVFEDTFNNDDNNGEPLDVESSSTSPISSSSSPPSNFSFANTGVDSQKNSCTTCDQSCKSSIQSFLTNILERLTLKMIDLDYFVKCVNRNKEYIFLFFVDVLDVLVSEIVEG